MLLQCRLHIAFSTLNPSERQGSTPTCTSYHCIKYRTCSVSDKYTLIICVHKRPPTNNFQNIAWWMPAASWNYLINGLIRYHLVVTRCQLKRQVKMFGNQYLCIFDAKMSMVIVNHTFSMPAPSSDHFATQLWYRWHCPTSTNCRNSRWWPPDRK